MRVLIYSRRVVCTKTTRVEIRFARVSATSSIGWHRKKIIRRYSHAHIIIIIYAYNRCVHYSIIIQRVRTQMEIGTLNNTIIYHLHVNNHTVMHSWFVQSFYIARHSDPQNPYKMYLLTIDDNIINILIILIYILIIIF